MEPVAQDFNIKIPPSALLIANYTKAKGSKQLEMLQLI